MPLTFLIVRGFDGLVVWVFCTERHVGERGRLTSNFACLLIVFVVVLGIQNLRGHGARLRQGHVMDR